MAIERAVAMKQRLARNERCLGLFASASTPIELLDEIASVGCDFVVFECEHGAVDEAALAVRFEVALLRGISPIVRLRGGGPIERLLDLGALGVMIAGGSDPADIGATLETIYYPPLGTRGYSSHTLFGRLAMAGSSKRSELMASANDAVVVVVQIETASLREQLVHLLGEPRIDVLTVGSSDLAVADGEPDRPAGVGVETILGYTRAEGTPAKGISVRQGADVMASVDAAFVTLGHDSELFATALHAAAERARSTAARTP